MLPWSHEWDRQLVGTGVHSSGNQRETKSLHLPSLPQSFNTSSLSNILRFIAVWLVSMGFRGVFLAVVTVVVASQRIGDPSRPFNFWFVNLHLISLLMTPKEMWKTSQAINFERIPVTGSKGSVATKKSLGAIKRHFRVEDVDGARMLFTGVH